MTHSLPKLPYGNSDLEPYISEKTINFHYGKHHAGYVDKLNILIKGTEFESASLEDIIMKASGAIFNNAAQIWNHTFYFEALSAKGETAPTDKLANAVASSFGSLEKLKEEFNNAAVGLFGSGWVWLVEKSDGSIAIIQKSNAENPLKDGMKPLMTCDVWEHAYYLDYQNRRPEYLQNFWKILDWKIVSSRY